MCLLLCCREPLHQSWAPGQAGRGQRVRRQLGDEARGRGRPCVAFPKPAHTRSRRIGHGSIISIVIMSRGRLLSNTLSNLALTSQYFHLHFAKEETGAQRTGTDLPEATRQVRGTTRTQKCCFWLKAPAHKLHLHRGLYRIHTPPLTRSPGTASPRMATLQGWPSWKCQGNPECTCKLHQQALILIIIIANTYTVFFMYPALF